MTVGVTPSQADLIKSTASFVEDRVRENSVWAVLHRECHRLFPDDMFADLFASTGRRSVPPRIVAVVMVLQKWHGLSDREAVEAFEFDARWKYACGGLDFDYPGFVHTVLVDMRARLARSQYPKRIFEVTLDAASAAGVVGVRRVLDSTPLYDAVATMDTVTLIRSAIRGLLQVADNDLASELRGVLVSGDDYASAAKPQIDWDDPGARDALIDSRARDAYRCLMVIDGTQLSIEVGEAAELLATVVGQDIESDSDGAFRIIRGVATDRVISTVEGLSSFLCEVVGSCCWVEASGEADSERVECLFPALGPGAEFTSSGASNVADGEVKDLEYGVVGGEMTPSFGDFPELIMQRLNSVGCVDDLTNCGV